MVAVVRCLLIGVFVTLVAACAAPMTNGSPQVPGGPQSASGKVTSVARTAAPASLAAAVRPPYPIPSSCAVTPTTPNEVRERLPAWWLDGRRVSVGTPIGVLYQGDNKLYWTLERPVSSFTMGGTLVNGPAATARLLAGGPQSGGPSTVMFSAPGCWTIHAEGGDQRLDATVYVYSWGCRPEGMRGTPPPSTETCGPPTA